MTLLEYLAPKRFSRYGYVVAILCGFAGAVLAGVASGLSGHNERQEFRCAKRNNLQTHDQDFMQTKCYSQYDKLYNLSLSLFGFVLLSFLTLEFVCFIYVVSSCGKCFCLRATDNPGSTSRSQSRMLFFSYLIHLVTRFGLGLFFALYLGLKAPSFPTDFQCKWDFAKYTATNANRTHSNSSVEFIVCHNTVAREKTTWALVALIVHGIFAFLVFSESFYLLARACYNRNFMYDSEFRKVYFLRRNINAVNQSPVFEEEGEYFDNITTFIQDSKEKIKIETEHETPMIPLNPLNTNDKGPLTDELYIELIICEGTVTYDFRISELVQKSQEHEITNVYLNQPPNSININNINELFLRPSNSISGQQQCKTILIVGRPGIGKSLLCKKIIREWAQGELPRDTTRPFKFVFVFIFRNLNPHAMAEMSLKEFLKRNEYSTETSLDDNILQALISNPQELLLIFDGLDEFRHRDTFMNIESDYSGYNSADELIPFAARYAKLLKGRILSGATVITTTRPNAVNCLLGLSFNRVVEVLGFNTEKIMSYVETSCSTVATAEIIKQHIKSNINLLYLCYIPVTCAIVCALLEHKLEDKLQATGHSVSLPTTLTEVYSEALRMFIIKHHQGHQSQSTKDLYAKGNNVFPPEATELGPLARRGIADDKLIFEENEVNEFKDSCLLHCMPSKKKANFGVLEPPVYCFLHLTLQEFLAAIDVCSAKNSGEIIGFINSIATYPAWHLVIQFIAGLVMKEGNDSVIDYFMEKFYNVLVENADRRLTLVMMRCFHEFRNRDVVSRVTARICNKQLYHDLDFSNLHMTSLDCSAIVYCLKCFGPSSLGLNFSNNKSLVDGGCSELALLIKDGCLRMLNLGDNGLTDDGVSFLHEALKSEQCQLTTLRLEGNHLSDKGLEDLLAAIRHNNCKLTELHLGKNAITDSGVFDLCEALKDQDCRLTVVGLNNIEISDEGAKHLCDALQHEMCKLTVLYLEGTNVTDAGVEDMSKAMKHEHSKLTKLFIGHNVTDSGVRHLCDALRHANCKLTALGLSDTHITKQGLSDLYRVIVTEQRRAKITLLDVGNFHFDIDKDTLSMLSGLGELLPAYVHPPK